jgi:hypothetical protein
MAFFQVGNIWFRRTANRGRWELPGVVATIPVSFLQMNCLFINVLAWMSERVPISHCENSITEVLIKLWFDLFDSFEH